jgi:hypothetical protein
LHDQTFVQGCSAAVRLALGEPTFEPRDLGLKRADRGALLLDDAPKVLVGLGDVDGMRDPGILA